MRVLEDMVDPKLLRNAANPWVAAGARSSYEIHFLFPNPDGWAKGDVIGSVPARACSRRAATTAAAT